MYGSTVIWTFKSGTQATVSRAISEIFAPALQQELGFRHYYRVRTGEDSCVTFIVYDTKEHAEAAFASMAALVREHVGGLIEGMQRSAGEIEDERTAP